MDSGLSNYGSALDRLFARTGSTSKFGLGRTKALLSLLADPQLHFRALHIAGTNGKGSVVATLDALLRAKGFSVGRYTSPHLVDFRERIAVNGTAIAEADVDQFLSRWESEFERLGATFFEITTALAFHHFAAHRVDLAVIETGLGGRLDSTNVIMPIAAAVTSIGIDHTEYLGSTIGEIAREKGGIFKRGIPAIYGRVSDDARTALESAANAAGASPIVAAESLYSPSNIRVTWDGTLFDALHAGERATLRTGLIGKPQALNACIALAVLDMAGEPFASSLDEARWILPTVKLPGRFQRVGKFILDVAHNLDGISALVETLQSVSPPRPLVAVVAILRDKDWQAMMRTICPFVDSTIVTAPPSAPAERAWDPMDAQAFGKENGWDVTCIRDLSAALESAAKQSATILVTGSFHTVGDASVLIAPC